MPFLYSKLIGKSTVDCLFCHEAVFLVAEVWLEGSSNHKPDWGGGALFRVAFVLAGRGIYAVSGTSAGFCLEKFAWRMI